MAIVDVCCILLQVRWGGSDILQHISEAVVQWCFVKKVFLEISQNSQKNTRARVSLLIKLQAPALAYNFIKKETLTQVFSCEFCGISKDTFSYRAPLVAVSSSSK